MNNEMRAPMSEREIRNAKLSRKAATQGMVLLENNHGALPLDQDKKKIALFGGGAIRTVRGGTGSGDPFNGGISGGAAADVNQSPRYHINIMDSFLREGYEVLSKEVLNDYAVRYDKEMAKVVGNPMITFAYPEMTITDDELSDCAGETDTAIYVLSRNSGEGTDRTMTKTITIEGVEHELGDYQLSKVELDNLQRIATAFPKTILVLNIGGVIDMDFLSEIPGISAVLLMSQAGQESGDALLDVLSGKVTPSGKLTDTWAKKYVDYPASETFSYNDNNVDKEKYEEGIYVGYRYFDTFGIKPFYEFGYGISYTDFSIECLNMVVCGEWVKLSVNVTNTGDTFSGKEVVQAYYSAPGGWSEVEGAEKPFQELATFAKTKELAPGECENLNLRFRIRDMASYHENGAYYKLDSGEYRIRIGNSSRNTKPVLLLKLTKPVITEQLLNEYPLSEELQEISKKGAISYTPEEDWSNPSIKIIEIDGSEIEVLHNPSPYKNEEITTYTFDSGYKAQLDYEKVELLEKKSISLKDVWDGKESLEYFTAQMALHELAKLNCGTGWGVSNENAPIVGGNSSTVSGAAGETAPDFFEKYGIPSIVLADGPAGIRVNQEFEATNIETGEKITRNQYCTAWPVGVLLGQSFDTELLYEVGRAMGEEAEEMGVTLILGPSLNIHRDPLCGRNFEYFSEDPLVSGIMAAAITKGMQSHPGIGACIKHFVANNQESNRYAVDTIVGERTLREIYLKGFEIAVKTAQPMSIMTSYNLVNGIPTGDSYDLNTNIARGEWGFKGLIMTDWNGGQSTPAISMHAGNDLIMPGGESRIRNIVMGAKIIPPAFAENGQIAIREEQIFTTVYFPEWNSFTVAPDGDDIVTAELGEGFTAEEKDGNILVNGETIYLNYVNEFSMGHFRQEFADPVTTEVASISNNGRSIVYKGNMKKKPTITLGDVQRCARNNLYIIMHSIGMKKAYPEIELKPYSEIHELEEWI
ncbi:glycoside hydrolase family 3 protein [Lederbergia panacisoli]|uniref:glycoside hydrolase family 3 protein n=1 Tax=Lederbergia panacisoli TaxID=1255251 RepID=UPI00214B81FD|nr:glycoside hydrolase family 3 protein [Lederbergia panacisoli]MCR2823439.1 glycoside hydrolase family 3 C-terminal domain-containing protein [Lederbergia panacisoli]